MTELRFGSAARLYSSTINESMPNQLDLLDRWFPCLIVQETEHDGAFRKEAEYNDRGFCIEAVKYNGSFYAGGSRRVAQITGRLVGSAKGNQEKERKTASILQKHLAEVMVTDLSVLPSLQRSVLERIEKFNEEQRESFYVAILEYVEAVLVNWETKAEYERLEELFPLDSEVFEGILYNAVYQMVIQTDQSIANGYLWLLLGGLLRNEAGRVLRLYDSSFIPIRRQSSEDGSIRDKLRYLIAAEQYESFYEGDDLDQRYPGIEWYCDRCEAHLNEQEGFTDRNPIWVCTACGYENRIGADVIFNNREDYHHQIRPMTEEEVRHAVDERADAAKHK
ncbi:MAG: hypothetical protein IJ201_02165 [Solobacterium sp.]|nr:hypothetical protein [Solobacterium sp.]